MSLTKPTNAQTIERLTLWLNLSIAIANLVAILFSVFVGLYRV